MATRKTYSPAPTNDESAQAAHSDLHRRTAMLSEPGFNNVIRFIKNASASRLQQLDVITKGAIDRLKLMPTPSCAIRGPAPFGSDQVDIGSLRDWMAKITDEDEAAQDQIESIYATIRERLG